MNIKKIVNNIVHYIRWAKVLWHPLSKTAYLLATPTHNNIGDLSIVVAEEKFLYKCGYERVVNIVVGDCWDYFGCIARLLPWGCPVYFHGGGNMGDIYLDEQLRRIMFPLLNKHELVLFPQTIFYHDTEEGNNQKENSVNYYNHENITLAARETNSYEIMQKLYPNATSILVPDIVFFMGVQSFEKERNGILFCFRDDQEKAVSDEAVVELQEKLKEKGYMIGVTSMIYYRYIVAGMWETVVREKMEEIAATKLLITDRLHGMIFAALTQTPCIVFGNNHYKVYGVYKWIEKLDYIRFVSSVDEALRIVNELYNKGNCKFEFDMKLFDSLKETIKEKGKLG